MAGPPAMSTWVFLLLLLGGDIETNPGPKKGAKEDKGPTVDDKIRDLGAMINQYEEKVQGLEKDIQSQRDSYDKKIEDLSNQIQKMVQQSQEQVSKSDFESVKEALESQLKSSHDETEQRADNARDEFSGFQKEMMERSAIAEEKIAAIESHISEFRRANEENVTGVMNDTEAIKASYTSVEQEIKNVKIEATGKLQALQSVTKEQRREYKSKFVDMDIEFQRMRERLENIHLILDDMQEKMYEFEQNKKNNLILYGVTAKHPETSESLRQRISNLFRDHLNIRRDINIQKATRILQGPEVQGCRPVLVTFETFKERETVLRNAKALSKKARIHVTEDLSKRTREARAELRKFMRQVKRQNPERSCFLEYDKLYVDHRPFVWNEVLGQVVEASQVEKFNPYESMFSRPGTQMGMAGYPGGAYGMIPSRPPSGMSVTGGAGKSLESLQHPRSASAVRLPPLTRATSLATGMAGMFDPREEKLNEMERMLNQYQEKLETVTNNYEEKVTILENRLVDREMDEHPRPEEGGHGDDSLDSIDRQLDTASPRFTQEQLFPPPPMSNGHHTRTPSSSHHNDLIDEITAAAEHHSQQLPVHRAHSSPTKSIVAPMPPIIMEEEEELKHLNGVGGDDASGVNGVVVGTAEEAQVPA